MTEKEKIQAFCSKHEQAIVGVSRDKKKFGNLAFKELRKRGYQVYPVNPNAASIEDVPCYKSVYELPDSVQHVVILTPPEQSRSVYQACIDKGIPHIWIQQKAADQELLDTIHKSNHPGVITGHCILMFTEPVQGVHKLHRFVMKLLNKLPK